MARRRSKKKVKLGGLRSNRKIQILFLFALLGVGLLVSVGMPAQNIYGYNERTFNSAVFFIMRTEPDPYPQKAWDINDLAQLTEFPIANDDTCWIERIGVYVYGDLSTSAYNCYVKLVSVDEATRTIIEDIIIDKYGTAVRVSTPDGLALTWTDIPSVYLENYASRAFQVDITLTRNSDEVSETYTLQFDVIPLIPDMNLDRPIDATYVEGDPMISPIWSWNSEVTGITTITVDAQEYTTEESSWTLPEVLMPTTIGVHTISVSIEDPYGRVFTDSVVITIEESELQPLVTFTSTPNDLTFTEGELGNSRTWSFDNYQAIIGINLWEGLYNHYSYGVYYSNDFVFNVDNLAVGTHTLRLEIVDSNSFIIEDEVVITVLNAPPGISSPADVSFEVGDTGTTIWWSLNEDVTATLVITGTISDTHYPSTDLGYVQIVLDHLGIGEYVYTLNIMDYHGATNSDAVHVSVLEATVLDVTSPTITHPDDISGLESVTETISWTITDESSGTYTIERDGTQVALGNWESGDTVTYDVSESGAGSHTYIITCVDASGNEVSDEVEVTLMGEEGEPEPPPSDLGALIEEYGLYIVIGVVAVLIMSVGMKVRKKRMKNVASIS